MKKTDFDVQGHVLVPKHVKLSEKEKELILQKYNITIKQLPTISKKDPAIRNIEVNPGEVIEIIRKSPTVGVTKFYRVVIDG